jgi:hypothetical protein
MSTSTLTPIAARRVLHVGPVLGAVGLVVGSAGNLAQALIWQIAGGRPTTVEAQIEYAGSHGTIFAAACLVGALAVPFMAVGFIAAAQCLATKARVAGIIAGTLLAIGMWGFQIVQAAELVQLAAMFDGDRAAALWLDTVHEQSLLLPVGIAFMLGAPLGLLILTISSLIKAPFARWIAVVWLAFIVFDFGFGAVGPVEPHWLYFAGAVGLAMHLQASRRPAAANP